MNIAGQRSACSNIELLGSRSNPVITLGTDDEMPQTYFSLNKLFLMASQLPNYFKRMMRSLKYSPRTLKIERYFLLKNQYGEFEYCLISFMRGK